MLDQRDRVRAIVNDVLASPASSKQRRPSLVIFGAVLCVFVLLALLYANPKNNHCADTDRLVIEGLIMYIAEKEGLPRRRVRAELTRDLAEMNLDGLDSCNSHIAALILKRRAQ